MSPKQAAAMATWIFGIAITLVVLVAHAQSEAQLEVRVVDMHTASGVKSDLVLILGDGKDPRPIARTDENGARTILRFRCDPALGILAQPEDRAYYPSPMVFCGQTGSAVILYVQMRDRQTGRNPNSVGQTPLEVAPAVRRPSGQGSPGTGPGTTRRS